MKKFVILTIALALLLGACGGGNKQGSDAGGGSTQGGDTSAAVSGAAAAGGKASSFFGMFSSGTYHMKAKMVGDGGIETTMESFVKGDLMANTVEMGGEETKMILRDNKMYIVNDRDKTVMTLPMMDGMADDTVKTDGMNITGSGTAVFNGKNLPYEEYSDGEGSKAQYFMDGNNLAGIRTITSGSNVDLIILVLDQNVPGNVFDIPSGYQEMGLF